MSAAAGKTSLEIVAQHWDRSDGSCPVRQTVPGTRLLTAGPSDRGGRDTAGMSDAEMQDAGQLSPTPGTVNAIDAINMPTTRRNTCGRFQGG